MMRIELVASQPDRAGMYTVRFEDGSSMRLYRQTVEDFGLYAGAELSDDQIKKLKLSASAMSAKMRAVRIVAASSVSKKDLEQRLIQKGEDPVQAKAAVQWMSDMDLVDDRKTAEQIVMRCVSKGYGVSRAKQALFEKRIPKELWDDVLADYPDQTEIITTFLKSHLKGNDDPKNVRKVIDALIRRGHGYSQIRCCMETISLDADVFPEE